MAGDSTETPLSIDASELILATDERFVCETYIFDPAPEEHSLGRLVAVAETEARDGIGQELLDLVITALQREYYRDPSRSVITSFESALHQGNLVLHDTAESGVRDWMGCFHVAVGVLAGKTLHISTAGHAVALLVRQRQASSISEGLSHSPITNPLRTFSQVASGSITHRDYIILGTSAFTQLFRTEDLTRLTANPSATTFATRLKELHSDQKARTPVAALIASVLPPDVAAPEPAAGGYVGERSAARGGAPALSSPRRPLVLQQSWLKTIFALVGRLLAYGATQLTTVIWPGLVAGSRSGGRWLVRGARVSSQGVQSMASTRFSRNKDADTSSGAPPASAPLPVATPVDSGTPPRRWSGFSWQAIKAGLRKLPLSSRVFAIIVVVLAIALTLSLFFLQQKRTDDAAIVHASEVLEEARRKTETAETALIYDNREQARTLLGEAQHLATELEATGLYEDEQGALESRLTDIEDRLQKITRTAPEDLATVGTFGELLPEASLTRLILVDDSLYTFNPQTNALAQLTLEGTATIVQDTTQEIGFLAEATAHLADKTVFFTTDTPGVALFDTQDATLAAQEIQLPSAAPQLEALATFGNRLYLYDAAARNIFLYNKTLRGFSGGTPWITAPDAPTDNIISIGIDGSIYALYADGSLRQFFKGEPTEFTIEAIQPAIGTGARIQISEDFTYLYVIDPTNKRIVIYTDEGVLVRQLVVDQVTDFVDAVISPNEETLYVLDGTEVRSVSLLVE